MDPKTLKPKIIDPTTMGPMTRDPINPMTKYNIIYPTYPTAMD